MKLSFEKQKMLSNTFKAQETHYQNLKAEYSKKHLPINIQELVNHKYFMCGFSELLKHKNIKLIKIDGKVGKKIKYTSDKFYTGTSLLCLLNNTIMILGIHSIESRRGYFTQLVENILKQGFDFEIVSPFDQMIRWTEKNKDRFGLKFYDKDNELFIVSNK